MKYIILLLIIAPLLTASAQWESIFIREQGTDLHDIHLTKGEKGVAVGKLGTILTTNDGFHTWKRQETGTTKDLYCLHFFDDKIAVAAGHGGVVVRSTDGGKTWLAISSGTTDSLFRLSGISEQVAIVVGSNGTILKTMDKGLHWSKIESGTTVSLLSVSFRGNIGIASGMKGIILRSIDAGETWQAIYTSTSIDLFTVSWATDSILFVGGDSSTIYRSVDGGVSWQFAKKIFSIPDQWTIDNILDIQFVNDSVGYMCGWLGTGGTLENYVDYQRIYYTNDIGKTWKRLIGIGDHPIYKGDKYDVFLSNCGKGHWRRLAIINPDSVIVVGGELTNRSSIVIAGGTNSPLFEVRMDSKSSNESGYATSGNYKFVNVSASSTSHLKVATSKGELMETIDTGKSWKRIMDTSGGNWNDMKFKGDFGVLVADSGRIYSTQDGGGTWTLTYIGKGTFSDVTIINTSTAFCMQRGYAGIIRTDDSGKSWKKIDLTTDIASEISVPYFSNDKQGWFLEQLFKFDSILGRKLYLTQSRLYSTSDGGYTWIDKTPYSVMEGRDRFWKQHIDFTNPLHGWITAFNQDSTGIETNILPIIFTTNDGGETWKRTLVDMQPLLSSNVKTYTLEFMDVMGIDSMNYILYLSYLFNNKVVRTNDGGKTWKEMTYNNGILQSNKLRSFYRADTTTIYMFGDNMLYRWDMSKNPTSVAEQPAEYDGIHLFPNPTSTQFTLSGVEGVASVRVVNSLGEEVKQFTHVSSQYSIDVSDLVSGLYFVSIRTAKGAVVKPMMVSR